MYQIFAVIVVKWYNTNSVYISTYVYKEWHGSIILYHADLNDQMQCYLLTRLLHYFLNIAHSTTIVIASSNSFWSIVIDWIIVYYIAQNFDDR